VISCLSVSASWCIVAETSQYKTYVVFHSSGYTVYDPHRCRPLRFVSADFDLSTRRSTRLQLTSASGHVTGNSSSMLCDVSCEWGDAVVAGNKFIYVSQPADKRVIVIDIKDSHSPVEVSIGCLHLCFSLFTS